MSEFFAICFDIRDPSRLRRVADTLENYGVRVQRSLFECYLESNELADLKQQLAGLIDELEDHVRFYRLCPKDRVKMIIDGSGRKTVDHDYFLI
jgi:CRISPR-associated protein Cas2